MAWPDTDVGQFCQVQVQGTLHNDQQFRNSFTVWGHDSASPPAVDDLDGFLQSAWTTGLIAAYVALLGSGSTLDGVLMRQVFDPLNPGDVKNEAYRSVGTAGGHAAASSAPTETCALLHIGTDVAGVSAHGRMFLPWFYDGASIAGEKFSPATLTAFKTIGTELDKLRYTTGAGHAGGAAVDFDLAVFSPRRRKLDDDQYGYRAVSTTVKNRIHWLRSRSPRG